MAKNNSQPFSSFLFPAIKALVISLFSFICIFFLVLAVFNGIHMKRIFPGVHIHGFPVGGLTVEEAAVKLTQEFAFFEDNNIALLYENSAHDMPANELGVSLDAVRSAIAAYKFGRSLPISKWLLQQPYIFASHVDVEPVIIIDETLMLQALKNIAAAEDISMSEAALVLDGTQVEAIRGQIGKSLDLKSSVMKITTAVRSDEFDRIQLVVNNDTPSLLDASPFISDAQAILDNSFVIKTPETIDSSTNKWTITPQNLAPMLTFLPSIEVPNILQPQFLPETLDALLNSIADQINKEPENPRFIFNDDTRELDLASEGIPGLSLNMQASIENIQTALAYGEHSAYLVIDDRDPEVDNDASADELRITELVHTESSYFYGSDPARVQNIETAANEFLGLLIEPGKTFSMASAMGDITLDNGYSEALIIYNGKTIEGVGGGVCQVSTTLFRTAFFAGFPIEERHPHAYRVSYYEKVAGNNRDPDLAGLDATVYIPLVDLKFKNDTPYWLLMEAYVNRSASRITWKFYSTYDGREMEWLTTGLTNIVEPKKPLYQLNEDLPSGEIKQIDWEAEGADVTVSRTVFRDGSVLFEDSFFTRYAPWRAVYEYGPGTEGIPDQETE